MKITYDPEARALYLYLAPAPEQAEARVVETVEAAPNVMLDRDGDGRVVGIEVLNVDGLSIETLAKRAEELA